MIFQSQQNIVFIFLVFEPLCTSDPLPLQPYCRLLALHYRCNWKPVFLAKLYIGTHLLYIYKFYYVGCHSYFGFLLVFLSVVFYFLMRRPTMCFITMIVSLIVHVVTCGFFRKKEKNKDPLQAYK